VKDARLRAHEFKALIAKDIDPLTERETKAAVPTFEDFALQQYLPFAKPARSTVVLLMNLHSFNHRTNASPGTVLSRRSCASRAISVAAARQADGGFTAGFGDHCRAGPRSS
jgi:hypothetical protein